MLVRDAMSSVVLTIGPTHTLRQAARLMSARRIGAAVVLDTDHCGIGILTERDILNSLGAGQNPDSETADTHTTTDVVFAAPSWTLEEAAAAMSHGGFRHLSADCADFISFVHEIPQAPAGIKPDTHSHIQRVSA